MKYVACYARVSTDEQAKFGFSIEAQKDALERYCKENNYKYEFYIDEGISASSMKKRKALNEMLSKANVFDMIIFTKLDRLSRNVLDANNINKTLQDNNCTMKAIDEDDIDTSTADGTFIFNLKVSLAQREIGKTSERIKFVFQNKRDKGEITSGVKKYGYNIINKRYVVNQEEAENIRNLYKKFIENNGNMKETYQYFIENFKNKGYDAMSNYLKDTAYIGKYKLYRKDVYIENYIPPIMDISLWNTVQNLRKKKSVLRTDTPVDKLSGLIYCASCGNRLSKKVDYRTKNKTINYVCDNNYRYKVGIDKKKCYNNKIIKEDLIEEYLLNNFDKLTNSFIVKNTIKPSNKKIDNSSKIKSIENKLNKLKDLYIDDLIDKETYRKDYTKLTDELNKLKNVNTELPIQKDFSKLYKLLDSNYIAIYNALTIENKKRFWLSYIDKIIVENGKIKEVTFL